MHNREAIQYDGRFCKLRFERPARGIVVLNISGHDVGEFGMGPMRQMEKYLSDDASTQLFIDARSTEAASIDVSSDWAQWLEAYKSHFEHISMLTGSQFIQITADFVRRFAGLGDVMRIYTEAAAFDRALGDAIADAG